MESHEARTSLQALDAAPNLTRRPSVVEVSTGVLSVLTVLIVPATLITSEPPRVVGVLVAAGLLALVVAWVTHRSPGRAAWGPIDHVTRWATLIGAVLPMQQLIWPPDDVSRAGAWIASSIAAFALGAFLAIRWRR